MATGISCWQKRKSEVIIAAQGKVTRRPDDGKVQRMLTLDEPTRDGERARVKQIRQPASLVALSLSQNAPHALAASEERMLFFNG
jgi:hypothetical protein